MQFVIEGSIQRDGDRLRVTAQLIDALSGRHIWADRFDRDIDDFFAVKDEITLSIASNIGAELVSGEVDRLRRRETNSLEACLLYQDGYKKYLRYQPQENILAREFFERAIAIDPTFTSAYTYLADTFRAEAQFGWTDEPASALNSAGEFLDRALAIDPDHGATRSIVAVVHLARGEIDLAVENSGKAVALDPNSYVNQAVFGWNLNFAGRHDEAVDRLLLAMRLSPNFAWWVSGVLGDAFLLLGQTEKATVAYEAILERGPGAESYALHRLALIYDRAGLEKEARDAIARVLELEPYQTISRLRRAAPFKDPSIMHGWAQTWRRLGLPE